MDQSQTGFDHVGLYPSCYFYRANERISAPEHNKYGKFDSKELMREHWQKCHDIALTDVFEPFVLPDATKEPGPLLRLPSTVKGDRGRNR